VAASRRGPIKIGLHRRDDSRTARAASCHRFDDDHRVAGMTTDALTVAVPASIGAAASFAVANVTQMRAARRQQSTRTIDPRLLVHLATEPLWLAGLGASIVGFALEATALAVAPVVLVQPLIVAELLFALPLAAAVGGGRLGRREWTGAVLVALGLIAFVVIIRPSDAAASASWKTWLLIACLIAGLVALLLRAAGRCDGVRRTSASAAAAGISLGMLSVLTKQTMREFGTRGLGAFATVAPWAVIAVGIFALWLAQTTFRAGPLAISLPLIDVGEPLVASLVAVMAFRERLGNLTVATSTGLVLAAGLVAAGVVLLDHSPVVQAAQASLVGTAVAEPDHAQLCLGQRDADYPSPEYKCARQSRRPDTQVPRSRQPSVRHNRRFTAKITEQTPMGAPICTNSKHSSPPE
jgi:drug/metabolite transporter (DMT)-like permease